MDFDFPAPYHHEVPRRIGEARRQLSPEGVAVLEGIIAETGNLEDVIVAMESLPASDRCVLVDVSRFFAEAYDAQIRESEGWAGLQRHLAALILRARELDPSLRVGATLGEALVVLKRHGERLSISASLVGRSRIWWNTGCSRPTSSPARSTYHARRWSASSAKPPRRKHGSSLRTLRLASTSAASAAACAASKRCRRAAYSGPVSPWAASPFNAASSPTSPERSRAVSPGYVLRVLRAHL